MIDLRADILAEVKRILKKHAPGAEVRVFGSRVNRTAKPYSDLDLAVRAPGKLDLKILGDLKEAFQESDIPIRVDVVDWQTVGEEFREVIARKNEVIQKGRISTPPRGS